MILLYCSVSVCTNTVLYMLISLLEKDGRSYACVRRNKCRTGNQPMLRVHHIFVRREIGHNVPEMNDALEAMTDKLIPAGSATGQQDSSVGMYYDNISTRVLGLPEIFLPSPLFRFDSFRACQRRWNVVEHFFLQATKKCFWAVDTF